MPVRLKHGVPRARLAVAAAATLEILLALAFFALATPAQAGTSGCAITISPDKTKTERTVFLAGGDSWDLFQSYLQAARSRNIDVDLWGSQVRLIENGSPQNLNVSRPWLTTATDALARNAWQKQLKGRKADSITSPSDEGSQHQSDVFCVGSTLEAKKSTVEIGRGTSPEVSFQAGMAYASRGDMQNAVKEWKAVAEIDRKYPDLQMNLGVAHMVLKNYVVASEHLTEALKATPNHPGVLYNMACLQSALGQKDDAVKNLERAVAKGFDRPQSLKTDPDLKPLRGHPLFEKLLKRLEAND